VNSVILLEVVSNTIGLKPRVLLLDRKAGLFNLTSQVGLGATPPKTSETDGGRRSESASKVRIRLPTNNHEGDPQPQVEVVETVKFFEDEAVDRKVYPKYVSIGEEYKNSGMDDRVHDIKSFLARPMVCWQGSWATTKAAGTQLCGLNLPAVCMTPSFKEKLRGFFGFRAKMVCRLQVNGQRFQQGRLIVSYLPQGSTMQAERINCAMSSLTLITQQPRIDLDLATETEVILEVPYVSPTLYFSLLDGTNDFGNFYVTVYSPLVVGSGASTVSCSVWCHFEDIEVIFPAAPGLFTQSGVKRRQGRGGASGGSIDHTGQELQAAGLGPISGLAQRVSGAANILSEIPLISAFTAPAAWAAGIVGRAAGALGYSKPTIASVSGKATLTAFPYMNNVNAGDNSSKMALTTDNHIENLPGFAGTDLDEMALSSILGISSYFRSLNWNTSAAYGTELGNFVACPQEIGSSINISDGTNQQPVRYYPPMGFISNVFQYWRGSITFTFKVVKTEFHSGRILAAFFPGQGSGVAQDMAAAQYCYREIFDLRTANEFAITVPYTALTPYLRYNATCGILRLFVINPLVAPNTVAQSIEILCEANGAPDMEFAFPCPGRQVPIIFTPQSGVTFNRSSRPIKLWAQGMGDNMQPGSSAKVETPEDCIAGATHVTLEPARYCIGERVLSIRQLIKRAGPIFVNTAAGFGTVNNIVLYPSGNYIPKFKTGAPITKTAGFGIDYLSYFSTMFRYWRGATRYKVLDAATPGATMIATLDACDDVIALPAYSITTNSSSNATNMNSVVTTTQMQGGIEVEVPFYSAQHSRPVLHSCSTFQSTPLNGETRLTISQSSGFSTALKIYRAAGDDFSFGFFIGTVPLTTAVATP